MLIFPSTFFEVNMNNKEEERNDDEICEEQLDINEWEENANPDVSLEHLVDYIQEKPTFAMFGSPTWNDDVPTTIRTFLGDPTQKTIFIYQSKGCISAQLEPANLDSLDMCWYFLKIPAAPIMDDADVEDLDNLQFGTLKSSELQSCQARVFSLFRNEMLGKCSIYNPAIQYHTLSFVYPDSTSDCKTEFAKHFYSFICKFIKTCAINMHETILVAPGVFTPKCTDGKVGICTVSYVKSLAYLEVLSLNWVQQCDEMISLEVINTIGQAKEPLEDLAILKPCLKALTRLNEELSGAFVHQMRSLLIAEKSPFVQHFDRLKQQIVDSMETIKFRQAILLTMEDSCHKFHNSSLKDAPLHLADLVDHVAKFYQDPNAKRENSYATDDLVKMVCNSVIVRCTSDISTDNICRGYKSSIEDINESIALCELCKTMFVQASNQRRIRFKESCFKRIILFELRCKDLIQICEGAELFGKWNEGDTTELFPVQPRPHQRYFDNVLLEIMVTFDRFLEHLSINRSELLDLDSLKWINIKQRYEDIIIKVEMLCRNSINSVFNPSTEVEEGIEILSYFSHLSKQKGVDHLYVEKANQLFQRLVESIPSVRGQISKLGDMFHNDDHRLTDIAVMAHEFERKIAEPMDNISKTQWFPTTVLGERTKSEISKLHDTVENFISKIFSKWGQHIAKFRFGDKLNVPLMRKNFTNCDLLECNLDSNILESLQNAVLWQNFGRDVQAATGCSSETCVSVVNLFEEVRESISVYNQMVEVLSESQTLLFNFTIDFLDGTHYPGFIGQTWLTLTIQSNEYNDWKAAVVQLKDKYQMFKSSQDRINGALEDIGMLSLLIFDNNCNFPVTIEEYDAIKNHRFEEFCNKSYEIYHGISLELMTVKATFQEETEKMEYEWLNLLDDKDKLFDKFVTMCISKSLLEVETLMSDQEKHPILKLKIDNNNEVIQTKNIQLPMVTILDEMLALVNRFPSFQDILTKPDLIHTRQLSPESRDTLESIFQRISAKATEVLSSFLNNISQWAQYEEILGANQKAFFEAYKNSNPKTEIVQQDLSGYIKIAQKIEALKSVCEIGFLQVDYTDLQKDLLNLADVWKSHFEKLLS